MFKFLKEKIKSAISKISEGVEKEGKAEENIIEKSAEKEKKEEKGFFAKIKEKFAGKEESKEIIESKLIESKLIENKKEIHEEVKFKEKIIPKIIEHKKIEKIEEKKKEIEHDTKQSQEIEKPDEKIQPSEEKAGFFKSIKEKIITTRINESQFDKLFENMEMALMENNVALEVIEKIKNDLKKELVERPIKRTKVGEAIQQTLRVSIEDLFKISSIDIIEEIKNKKEKPYVIAFFGINGSGKTTSIAKIANMLKEKKISCVLAASDTFRAASIEQLSHHAGKIGVNLIKHNYGSDPAAVAFDAIKHAKAKNIDAVLIDTAGRMHSNSNLIDEMKKIIRVSKPDLKIFVGESITGNDCVEQAKSFNEAVGIDAIILAKADVDEKGGAAISVSYVTKKPILFLGTGQEYEDLEPFNREKIIKNIGLA